MPDRPSIAGDATIMLARIQTVLKGEGKQPMTFRVAKCTSRLAFNILAGKEFGRGLVWTRSLGSPEEGEVHYDRDPSYPHECCSPTLTAEMTAQLQAIGKQAD